MQTILGASGAIGTELAKALKNYTDDIRLVSRNPKKINDTDTILSADLTQREEVFRAVKGSSIVYLTVGLEYNINVWKKHWPALMTNVIDACIENNARFVFFDSVYMIGGDNVKHITEESPFSPTSKKGEMRVLLNKMILNAIETRNLKVIIARAPDFYGAVKDRSMPTELIYKNLIAGKKAQWLFNAKVKHSFIYVPDAAKATALLGNTEIAYNQIWNLPTDKHSMTGEEWIQLFAKEMGKSAKYQLVPAWMVCTIGIFVRFMKEIYEMRYQFDRDYFFDSSKFENYFKVKPTSYQEGVKETLAALKQNPVY